jgi:hypothetical protein
MLRTGYRLGGPVKTDLHDSLNLYVE